MSINVTERLKKDRNQRWMIVGLCILAAFASSLWGIKKWRNFNYLINKGVEADAIISEVARRQRSSKTVTITFVTASEERVTDRCLVSHQFYYDRIEHADLTTPRFKVRYCEHSPRNFLVVDGTDPQIDAYFCISGFLCFIAAIAVLPTSITVAKANIQDSTS